MSIKTYLLNSDLAQWTAEEFMATPTLLGSEGVFDDNGTHDDFEVTESSPQAMTVDVNTGAALVEFTTGSVTWKVVVKSNAVETATITANATGSNRVDAVVIELSEDEASALKTNVASITVVPGTGITALSDSAITAALGHANWYRLANVTVPNGASSISDSDITDTRSRVTWDALPADGDTEYVTISGGDQVIASGVKTFLDDGALSATTAAPTNARAFANKQYVDDQVASNAVLISCTSGEAISVGETVYIKAADGKAYLTNATGAGEQIEAFLGWATTSTAGADETVTVNIMRSDNQTGLTVGDYMYLSDTPGAMANTPGTYEKLVGLVTSATQVIRDSYDKIVSGTLSDVAKGSTTAQTVTLGWRPKLLIFSVEIGAYANDATEVPDGLSYYKVVTMHITGNNFVTGNMITITDSKDGMGSILTSISATGSSGSIGMALLASNNIQTRPNKNGIQYCDFTIALADDGFTMTPDTTDACSGTSDAWIRNMAYIAYR